MSCTVELTHLNKTETFQIRPGLGFQALAVQNKTPLEFDCRKSDCGICLIHVASGSENLSPKTEAEMDFLKAMGAEEGARLACQANIMGPVAVELPSENTSELISKEVILTDRAVKMAHRLQDESPKMRGLSLRLYVEGKGCDGFTYGVAFDDPLADDIHYPQGGIDLVVDPRSFKFVSGSSIEWVDDERGRGFLVDNPRHDDFKGKFYKKAAFRASLEGDQ